MLELHFKCINTICIICYVGCQQNFVEWADQTRCSYYLICKINLVYNVECKPFLNICLNCNLTHILYTNRVCEI